MTQKTFCKAGIQPLWTHVLGFMLLVMVKIGLLGCKITLWFWLWIQKDGTFYLFFFKKIDFCSDLGNAKLSGKLVPELGKLERLQYLWVQKSCINSSVLFSFSFLKFLCIVISLFASCSGVVGVEMNDDECF